MQESRYVDFGFPLTLLRKPFKKKPIRGFFRAGKLKLPQKALLRQKAGGKFGEATCSFYPA
jgi:hypothetical protein